MRRMKKYPHMWLCHCAIVLGFWWPWCQMFINFGAICDFWCHIELLFFPDNHMCVNRVAGISYLNSEGVDITTDRATLSTLVMTKWSMWWKRDKRSWEENFPPICRKVSPPISRSASARDEDMTKQHFCTYLYSCSFWNARHATHIRKPFCLILDLAIPEIVMKLIINMADQLPIASVHFWTKHWWLQSRP